MNLKTRWLFVSFLAGVLPLRVFAVQVEAVGEYMYGPDTSDAQACRLAVLAAKNNALLERVGEDITIDQSYACAEGSDDDRMSQKSLCTLNKFLWSQVSGEIQSFKVMGTSISTLMGSRSCSAKILAEIQPRSKVSPLVDFAVVVNGNTLRSGEKLKITITPERSIFLNVYSWTLEPGGDGSVTRIFPNKYQKKSFLNAQLTIPNQDYDIVVGLKLPGVEKEQSSVQLEHLIFVASKTELIWPEKMSYDDFSRKVFESDPQQVRIRKKTLSVVSN